MSKSIRNICPEPLLLCMKVEWLYSGDPWANAYVVGNILVDAGVMPMAVAPYKEQIETIVLTHCHFDHIARLKEIAHMCKAKVAIHKTDARGLVDDIHSLAMHFGARSPGVVPDINLADGDRIGDFIVLNTPGHTPGCICLYSEKDRLLFSGDTVFADGYFGRYDFPGGSRAELARSLDRLSALDVEGLFAGHGEPTEENGSRSIAAAVGLMKSGYG
jgi:hydroxyacylglutathione hydrolase